MDTNRRYQNISIQPPKIPRTSKTIYELPKHNLTESDLAKKSTSDRIKRRVAHVARYPRPVITSAAVPPAKTVPQRKPIKKHDLKKFYSRVQQPYSSRRINDTAVALDSARAQPSQSTSSGVEDRVKADKRKLVDIDFNEIIRKKQKKANVDKPKNKNVQQEKKSHSLKGADDKVKADKNKLAEVNCGEVPEKGNFQKSKNKYVEQGKKSHSRKGVDKRVIADKIKSGDLQDKVTKKKQKKNVITIKYKDIKEEKTPSHLKVQPNVDTIRHLFAYK